MPYTKENTFYVRRTIKPISIKMKTILTTSLILFIANILFAQQQAVDVAENTLKVNGFGEEAFYYGFAEGDQLIFNFEEQKGKELKEIEITEFMDYKSKKIENKTINITRTAIYKFRFANSAMSGRICKFKIQRIPANETTKNFNSSVLWRTVYDTSTRIVKERYLVKKEYKPVTVIEPSEYFINSGRNSLFQGGKSRITLPVNLPQNTIEWYYNFSASRDEESIKAAKNLTNLSGQLTKLIDPTRISGTALSLLTAPPGADYCDIYLLDLDNRNPFEEKAQYKYFPEGSRENIMSGVVRIKSAIALNLYIGFKNPDSGVGVHVVIEVVAITLEEEWGVKDVTKYDINSRQEAYLNN
jgi:hypothetical protein